MMEKKTVQATDLSKIKDLMDLKLKGEQILIKSVIKKKSDLILPEGMSFTQDGQLEVIKVGDRVRDIEVGDIILDWRYENNLYFYYKGDDKFIITDQHNILLSTNSNNVTI